MRRKLPVKPRHKSALLRTGPTGSPPTRKRASYFPDDAAYRLWFKGYEKWLRDLRTHFYDWREGYLGPEGDPVLIYPRRVSFAGSYALAESSRTSTSPGRTFAVTPEVSPVARATAPPVQLPLPWTEPVNYGDKPVGISPAF